MIGRFIQLLDIIKQNWIKMLAFILVVTAFFYTFKSQTNEILTAILVVITGIYAFFTYKILQANDKVINEMRMQRELLYRPYILVTVKPHPLGGIFYLTIKNTGLSVASNLELSIDKDFFQHGLESNKNNLRLQNAFNNRIDHFVPSAEIMFELAGDHALFSEDVKENILPKRFTITAEYEYKGSIYNENTIIDLEPYLNTIITDDSVAAELRSINQTIKSFVSTKDFEKRILNK